MDCSLPGSSLHGISQGNSPGVGCHFLLQGIFLTQGSNPGLLLYHLSHQGSPGCLIIQLNSDIIHLEIPSYSTNWGHCLMWQTLTINTHPGWKHLALGKNYLRIIFQIILMCEYRVLLHSNPSLESRKISFTNQFMPKKRTMIKTIL